MQCKKCGAALMDGVKFCSSCGKRVEIVTEQGNAVETAGEEVMPPTSGQVQSPTPTEQPKKKHTGLMIGLIVFGVFFIFGIVAAVFGIKSLLNSTKYSKNLICVSDKGSITIKYNDTTIVGYLANGMKYDLDGQKAYAEKIGVNAYILEFNNWFIKNTSGKCTIDGKAITSTTAPDDNKSTETTPSDNDTSELMTIGNDKVGYVKVPNNWVEFMDKDNPTIFQYSYAGVYIITLDEIDDGQHSALDFASNYYNKKKNDSEVTNVISTVGMIGKKYLAYQVRMYYPKDNSNLYTYFFKADDNKVHYMAFEGPPTLRDVDFSEYLYIPESFSMAK